MAAVTNLPAWTGRAGGYDRAMTSTPVRRPLLPDWLRPYLEREPLAALLLGISSGFPYAMIGATLTTRLAQGGVDKKSVTAFALAFLVYNLKVFWAPLVDRLRLPLLGRLGQRVSWLLLSAVAVAASVAWLGLADPATDLRLVAIAAIAVGVSGATFDIVIDAFRIETLLPRQLARGLTAPGPVARVVAARRQHHRRRQQQRCQRQP